MKKNIRKFKWDKVYNWMASGGFSLILYNLQLVFFVVRKNLWMQVVCVGRCLWRFCNGYSWWNITIKELIGRIICKNCSQYSNIILFQFKETSHYRDHSRWSTVFHKWRHLIVLCCDIDGGHDHGNILFI